MKRAIAITLLLGACVAEPPISGPVTEGGTPDGPREIPTGSGQRYDCDTGATFFANNGATGARVTLDTGAQLQLPRVATIGNGVQYAAEGRVWFVEGTRAVFTERGGQVNCRRSGGGF